jgi:copper(I)-binding protein
VNRALRAATVGVLLLSPVALSACSAGQVTQTATQNRDKTGAMAQVGDLTVRAVELEYPRGGVYEPGDDAELRLVVVNGGEVADTLVDVEGDGFSGVEIQGPEAPASTSPSAGPTTATGPTTPTGPTTANGSGSTGPAEIVIPPRSTVFVDGTNATITLTDLAESLTVGQYLELTFTFENAGTLTLPVTVANADKAERRGEAFDFHQEEQVE